MRSMQHVQQSRPSLPTKFSLRYLSMNRLRSVQPSPQEHNIIQKRSKVLPVRSSGCGAVSFKWSEHWPTACFLMGVRRPHRWADTPNLSAARSPPALINTHPARVYVCGTDE
ncbi:unnamed protein product [Ectocarpus sp. 4 AP-2014]